MTSSSITHQQSSQKSTFGLKKEISLFDCVAMMAAGMIGSGIFMTPSGIIAEIPSVGYSLLIWAGCGITAGIAFLNYMELSLLLKESGAEYAFLRHAYGDMAGYIMAWAKIIIIKPGSMALALIGFSEYFIQPFYPGCDAPELVKKLVAIVAIFLICGINSYSVKLVNQMQKFMFIALFAPILLIIGCGAVQAANGHTENFKNAFTPIPNITTSAIAVAFYNGMWSFDGWQAMTYAVEEVSNANYILPRAAILSLPVVTVVYVLMNAAYFTVLNPVQIGASSSVALTYSYQAVPASLRWVVPVGVIIATFSTANCNAFTSGRIAFVAARNNHLPKVLSYVDVIQHTPSVSMWFNAVIVSALIAFAGTNFSNILGYTTFTQWIFHTLSFLAVIVLRFKAPYKDMERPWKNWLIVPIIGTCLGTVFVLSPIIDDPKIQYIYALVVIFAGLILYFPLVRFGLGPDRVMDWCTVRLQRVFAVGPEKRD